MFTISDIKIGFSAMAKLAYLDSDRVEYDRYGNYPLLCHLASEEAVNHLKNGGKDTELVFVEDKGVLIVVTAQQAVEVGLSEVTVKLAGNQWIKPEVYDLKSYVDLVHAGSQVDLARSLDVKPQQITQWIDKEFFVVNDMLCSIRRKLKT